jgi:hypothetical protein
VSLRPAPGTRRCAIGALTFLAGCSVLSNLDALKGDGADAGVDASSGGLSGGGGAAGRAGADAAAGAGGASGSGGGADADCGPLGVGWSQTFGNADIAYGYDAASRSDGAFVVVGDYASTLAMGSVPVPTAVEQDGFVALLSSDGDPQWVSVLTGPGNQHVTSVALRADGSMVVAGYYEGDAQFGTSPSVSAAGAFDLFVAGLDANGSQKWFQSFGDALNQRGWAHVAIDPKSGDVALFGTFAEGEIPLGPSLVPVTGEGQHTLFVVRTNSSGQPLWGVPLGVSGPNQEDRAMAGVAFLPDGGIVVAGKSSDKLDLGSGSDTPLGGSDGFVAKLDAQGSVAWGVRIGDTADDAVSDVVVTDDGHVHIAGEFRGKMKLGANTLTSAGGSDVFVADLDSDGAWLYSERLGGAYDERAARLIVDPTGAGGYLAGLFAGSFDPGCGELTAKTPGDAFLLRFDAAHVMVAQASYSAPDELALTGTSTGGAVLFGDFSVSVEFGSGTTTSVGQSDLFAARIEP